MSIASGLYAKHIMDRKILGPQPKAHRTIRWGEVVEPIHYGHGDLELMLAALDAMLESSRKYTVPDRWGTYGVTGLLLDSSAVNTELQEWRGNGSAKELMERIRRTFTIGMLTGYHRAAEWREKEKIGMDCRVRLAGPFGDDHCVKAWERLRSLSGRDIIPLNRYHKRATRIQFTGIEIHRHYSAKRYWKVDYYVQYPREKFGSGWDLSHLCRENSPKPFDFSRGEKETLSQWLTRVAVFVESLLRDK